MLCRFLNLKSSLILLGVADTSDDDCIQDLNASNWETMKKLVLVLKPFEQLTKTLSYRDATSSEIIPAYLALQVYLKKCRSTYREFFSGLLTTVDEFFNDLTNRFDWMIIDKTLCLSTFLNPCYKNPKQKVSMRLLTDWILDFNDVEDEEESVPDPQAQPDQDNNTDELDIESLDMFDCFNEIGNDDTQSDLGEESQINQLPMLDNNAL